MDSVGSFQLKEIDGKRSFVYVPPIYSNEPAIDSSEAEGLLSHTGFLCPDARRCLDLQTDKGWGSPHFHGVTQHIESADDHERLDFFNRHVVLPLFWCNNEKKHWSEKCDACHEHPKVSADFYFCGECDERYHKECIESPPQINHSLHPKHPLQLSYDIYSPNCFGCKNVTKGLVYRCTLCKFSMHPVCAVEPIPYVIEQCKRHEHPLTYFTRKQASLDCNVCGLISDSHPTYLCVHCNFVAHMDCVDSPHVIRISRHQHRISFTLPLPPGNQSCGVCRKEVNRESGGYTSEKCENYVVHSRCALRKDVWDGEELQGVPEENDIEEVVDPFETISEGIILHFSHKHLLKLETSRVYDESKICEACVIPIYEGDFYSCGECDFILHGTCANAPRRKIHPLHPHPLTLSLFNGNRGHGSFNCDTCFRTGSGFIYECMRKECRFQLDVGCGSIFEPYDYQGHGHPLFLALDPDEKNFCHVCQSYDDRKVLNCIECDYIICFECVTIPYKARYKHDEHFLTLGYGDETSKPDWCELCEKQLPSGRLDKRFYTCNQCCTTLHITCLLGQDMYKKPGHIVFKSANPGTAAKILLNNSLSRPTCDLCKRRCEDKIIYRRDNKTWCSFSHIRISRDDAP